MLILLGISAKGQISPGKLAEPHKHLEGVSNCTKCHDLGDKVTDEKCLKCHELLDERIKAGQGFHASSKVEGKQCKECHGDHHGRGFEMIRFDREEFDHSLTGYELRGAHSRQDCEACHKKEFITANEIKKKESTYLGLSRECLSCHDDYHQGQLASSCTDCHEFETFEKTPSFDHSQADFALKGKHKEVDCQECHPMQMANGSEVQKFSGVAHTTCADCHEDVHDNKFGDNCSRCHTEESFHRIKKMQDFDHSQTDFALEGQHRDLECKSCHENGYSQPIEHKKCSDCHDDYHENQFAGNGESPDCDKCHSVEGFEQHDFTIGRHNQTPFPLEGAHAATPCFSCHEKANKKKWQYENIGKECNDCHEDIHKETISDDYYPEKDCEKCHTVNRWSEVTFDHSKTDFRLKGAHNDQSCRECHFIENAQTGKHSQQFAGLSSRCTECHDDIHYGQFEQNGQNECQSCHGFENWEADRFDHSQTDFKLKDAHADLACKKCHQPVERGDISYIKYKYKEFKCKTCHQ